MNPVIYREPKTAKRRHQIISSMKSSPASNGQNIVTTVKRVGIMIAAAGGIAAVALWGLTTPYPLNGSTRNLQGRTENLQPTVQVGGGPQSTISNEIPLTEQSALSVQPAIVRPLDQHRVTLERKVEILLQGRKFMKSIRDYSAQLSKQEVVRGELLDEQTILITCRHKPFSVYLRWIEGDVGREVLYIEGANNGKMVAHDGGWKARIPSLNLSPDCPLAMRDARYPVTNAGVICLINTMLDVHYQDLENSSFESCVMETGEQFDGRDCVKYTTKYQSRSASPVYRKSVTLIDREWNIPLHTQQFEWPAHSNHQTEEELDRHTLLESYSFRNLSLNLELSEKVFDRSNKDYNFR